MTFNQTPELIDSLYWITLSPVSGLTGQMPDGHDQEYGSSRGKQYAGKASNQKQTSQHQIISPFLFDLVSEFR